MFIWKSKIHYFIKYIYAKQQVFEAAGGVKLDI